ncbi:MAG TPA: isoamylase [Treponemataceae bacterium]|nr:isoamylase [Treponemataceae bacterium]
MKRIIILICFALCAVAPLVAAGIEAITYSNLVSTISRVRSPAVSGTYVVYTASGRARHTGIAFEHENYTQVHSFQRLIRKDEFGKPRRTESGKLEDTILFYIAQIPPQTSAIRYRIVVDGLWTADPENPLQEWDAERGFSVSVLEVDSYEVFKTSNVQSNTVRFTCIAPSGQKVSLAGSFNNWDPFMYEMTETSAGMYELTLPLPRGTWYYAYFQGTTQVPDTTNSDRAYTRDGRVASVITIP